MTYRVVSVFLCRGHARTSSDSEYVAESRALLWAGQLCTHISPIAALVKKYSRYLHT